MGTLGKFTHFDWSTFSYSHVKEKQGACNKMKICMVYILACSLFDKYQREGGVDKFKWHVQVCISDTAFLVGN